MKDLTKYTLWLDTTVEIFFFNKYGNSIKNDNESNVSQNILYDNDIMLWVSFVSICSQLIVSSDMRGRETIIDPRIILFFATSDAMNMIIADKIILITSNMIFCNFPWNNLVRN